jgi:hypothetical protein
LKVRALLLALAIGCVLTGGAYADWVAEMNSVLSGGLGNLDLHTLVTVDKMTGTYTYTYDLTATDVIAPVHHFDVGNPNQLAFFNAQNTGADKPFEDPVYQNWLTSVLWSYGEIVPTGTATFSYQSYYGPMVGWATALDLGTRAIGETYVMMVPEPASAGSMALLLLGLAGVYRYRRSS